MIIPKFRKIIGLLLFELENSGRFPIFEIFLVVSNLMLLIAIYGSDSFSMIFSLKLIGTKDKNFIETVSPTFIYYLFTNGFLFGLLLVNSFLNQDEKSMLITLFSYPISKLDYFLTKFFLYSFINFTFSFFFITIYVINSPLGSNYSIFILLIVASLINQLFSTILVLLCLILIKNYFVSNLVITVFWFIHLLFLESINITYLPKFINSFISSSLIFNYYIQNDISDILYTLVFSVLITLLIFYLTLKSFYNLEVQ